MCTLSWAFDQNGYRVYFNRDESRERQIALAPFVQTTTTGIQYIAPIDTDGGGSWMAVNDFGLCICLLNYYQGSEPVNSDAKSSRGSIVLALVASVNMEEVERRLGEIDFTVFAGFTLVAFSNNEAKGWQWGGESLEEIVPAPPMVSSLFKKAVVQSMRSSYFWQLPDHNPQTCVAFHASHFDGDVKQVDGELRAEHSVCMHRDDATTVSLCVVEANQESVSMTYTQGSPCSNKAGLPITLARR